MSTTLTERRQHLELTDDWVAARWDETPEFVRGQQSALNNIPDAVDCKAVDAIGVHDGAGSSPVLLLAELKDFDHPDIPDGLRAERDRSPGAQAFRKAVGAPGAALLVMLCIEGTRSQAVAAGPWTKDLQRRLRWLGPRARVVVTSRFTPFDELGIRYRVD